MPHVLGSPPSLVDICDTPVVQVKCSVTNLSDAEMVKFSSDTIMLS